MKSYSDVRRLAKEASEIAFDIYGKKLYRFILYKLDNGYGGFIILTHHIISDAATFGLIGTEIAENYKKLLNNTNIDKKDFSYEDYLSCEKEYMNSDKFAKDEEYWNNLYKSVPDIASFPSIKHKSHSSLDIQAKRKEYTINTKLLNKISDFCKMNKVSNFNFFMSVYAIYLGRVSNLNDFVIGTPILNRTNFKEKHTTGMFINTAPLRISLKSDTDFIQFSREIAQNSLSMLRYQKYPYEMLLQNLRKLGNNLSSLYDVMLSYQVTKAHDNNIDIPYEVEWLGTSTISDGMYIHLHDNNDNKTLNIAYDYQLQKYDEAYIENMHERILYIIEQVLDNVNLKLKDIDILTQEEKNKILYEFNDTKTLYPKDKTIIQLFEEQVKKTPDCTAVCFDGKGLTYRELNDKANSLALYLKENGINHGDIVCMLFDKSLEMIVSILSILKLGAIYLPIDIGYPKDRIDYIISDSNSKIVLTTLGVRDNLPFDLPNLLCVDLTLNDIYMRNSSFNTAASSPEDVAYIMYTSRLYWQA